MSRNDFHFNDSADLKGRARECVLDLGGPWEIKPVAEIAYPPSGQSTTTSVNDDCLPVTVPGAWQTSLGASFHGTARYRRTVHLPRQFRLTAEPNRRLWLRFQSVATAIEICVNGQMVGRHVGDYVPFQFDITSAVGSATSVDIQFVVDELHALPPERDSDLQNGHITKGFHDCISIQHGGVWQPVQLAVTGGLCARPSGIALRADPDSGNVEVTIELEPGPDATPGRMNVRIFDPDDELVEEAAVSIAQDSRCVSVSLPIEVTSPRRWSPQHPALYRAVIVLETNGSISEVHERRFGFRRVATDGRTIRLNGRPLFIRGILDWGHEPRSIAPMPSEDAVRRRFTRLREMGFNCICICMWYPPLYYYDIADEMGMLIWQEHPVWQPRMRDEDLKEYRRLYTAFLARDRNHPSVVIVSATCEHPEFHPVLADWWWKTARKTLRGVLLQVQTASFKWSKPEHTDLYDEHTYDNSNRWVHYLDDVQAHLDALPEEKPFVMGETVLFTSWPDVARMKEQIGADRPWWLPRCFEHLVRIEQSLIDKYGQDGVSKLRSQGDRFHWLGRKFQVEQFRRFRGNAGLVMNHLNDVPPCQCGFIDDLGRWRFAPETTRGWLGDAALLLITPNHRRAFTSSESPLACSIALSNYSQDSIARTVRLDLHSDDGWEARISTEILKCHPGAIESVAAELPLPDVESPT